MFGPNESTLELMSFVLRIHLHWRGSHKKLENFRYLAWPIVFVPDQYAVLCCVTIRCQAWFRGQGGGIWLLLRLNNSIFARGVQKEWVHTFGDTEIQRSTLCIFVYWCHATTVREIMIIGDEQIFLFSKVLSISRPFLTSVYLCGTYKRVRYKIMFFTHFLGVTWSC